MPEIWILRNLGSLAAVNYVGYPVNPAAFRGPPDRVGQFLAEVSWISSSFYWAQAPCPTSKLRAPLAHIRFSSREPRAHAHGNVKLMEGGNDGAKLCLISSRNFAPAPSFLPSPARARPVLNYCQPHVATRQDTFEFGALEILPSAVGHGIAEKNWSGISTKKVRHYLWPYSSLIPQ